MKTRYLEEIILLLHVCVEGESEKHLSLVDEKDRKKRERND